MTCLGEQGRAGEAALRSRALPDPPRPFTWGAARSTFAHRGRRDPWPLLCRPEIPIVEHLDVQERGQPEGQPSLPLRVARLPVLFAPERRGPVGGLRSTLPPTVSHSARKIPCRECTIFGQPWAGVGQGRHSRVQSSADAAADRSPRHTCEATREDSVAPHDDWSARCAPSPHGRTGGGKARRPDSSRVTAARRIT